MSTALECSELSVRRGQRQVFSHAELRVQAGEIVSIIGPTGSGKTTFTEICLNRFKPDSGSVKLLGSDAGSKEIVSSIACISKHMKFHNWDTVNKILQYQIHKGRNFDISVDYYDHVIDTLNIRARLNDRVNNLSDGEVCRLNLAAALVSGAKLIMIDEASTLLAYPEKTDVTVLINEAATQKRTVILLTSHPHLLDGIDTKMFFLRNYGFIKQQQSTDTDMSQTMVQIQTETMTDEALRELRKVALKIRIQGTSFNQFSALLSSEEQIPDLLKAMVMHGARVKSVYQTAATLEEIYQDVFLDQ